MDGKIDDDDDDSNGDDDFFLKNKSDSKKLSFLRRNIFVTSASIDVPIPNVNN